ncbi:universal stress protein, partial [bacterium]|nr:universal stress protein [bacterium]
STSKERAALERATALAMTNQACLTVVDVIKEIPINAKQLSSIILPVNVREKLLEERRQELEELISPWRKNIEIKIRVLCGIHFLKIIKEVLNNNHDLVIKTAESDGLLNRIFGSDDMHLLRKCPCPVWLAKSNLSKTYRRILAAVDVDDYYPAKELKIRQLLNLQTLEMATSLALSERAELHIVHTWEAIAENAMRHVFVDMSEQEIATYVEEVRQQHLRNVNILTNEIISKLGGNAMKLLKPQIHLLKGSPRKEIPILAGEIEADLVIMGTVARIGIPGFFIGNTAETILNRIDCSVLAIKPPGFETPVTLED